MNHGIRKILVTMSLALCLFGTVFATQVKAEDTNAGSESVIYERKVLPYTAQEVSDFLDGSNSYPSLDGYLFAGWYTEEKCDDTCYLGVNEPSGQMYALFIPKQVLGVQAQIKAALTDGDVTDDDTVTSLRFVTSVDSLNYREVGFYVTYVIGGQEYTAKSSSKKVYEELYYVDSTEKDTKVTPQSLFCNLSKYFKAGTVLDVPESLYGTEFKVQPFWITMEGDTVKGEEVVKSVDIGCVRDTVYVSSATDTDGNPIAQDKPYYGTYDYPYASLDYAIAHVNDNKTVRVRDELTVASGATWTAHKKIITITGDEDADVDTLDFSANNELSIMDSVTFAKLDMALSNFVYANGNSLKVAEDVNVTKAQNIYGGGKGSISSNTNLELYAGSYAAIFGGCHQGNVSGNTRVVVGGNVNPNATATDHTARAYMLYGGCRRGNVNGNTSVIVQTGAKFDAVYGGGGSLDTGSVALVKGATNVEFAGKAYSVFGGSRFGTNADTHVKITGGETYQVFGGCEHNSMTGNTDVQILGGKVYRRIYGGCYNEYSTDLDDLGWRDVLYQVTGNTSVTIGTTLDLNVDSDNALCALSRSEAAFEGETGVLIFQDDLYSSHSSKIHNLFGTHAYNYLVKASANGEVLMTKKGLSIEPSGERKALVRLDSASGEVDYYAEQAGTYTLPELKNSKREIYVTFPETVETANITITDSENGKVTSDSASYLAGTTATLTVTPESGYYCKSLIITKDGETVELTPEFAFGQKTYTFDTVAGEYTVEATFAKRVFENPSTSTTNTKWDVLQQNESVESLNGAIKVSGKVTATDIKDGTGTDTLNFIGSYTNMEVTFTVKETQKTPGSYASGTQVVFDFGGYVLQIRATHSGGVNYLRVVGGLDKNTNVHTFTEAQADKYNSEDGVEVRFVRYGTTLYMYVDGKQCDQSIDLNAYSTTYSKSTKEVTADTEMTVGFKFLSDTNTEVEIPFSITDMVTPVVVNVTETTDGTVTKKNTNYFTGDTVTLIVEPKDDYYCSSLSVKKDGEKIELPELTFTGKTYDFTAEAGAYTVEATFAKKVFEDPSASATNTKWDVLQQNESMESLANNAMKVSGKVTATDIKDGSGTDTLNFIGSYTDMEVSFTVKETQETPGSYASGTQVVYDFGGYVLQIRATHSGGVNYLRVVGGLDKNTNVHTFTEAQADKYNSEDGVEVRFVRYGTTLYMYVDGEQCDQSIDLNAYSTTYSKSTKEVTADTEMTVGFKFLSDTNTEVEIPFTITDTVTPVSVTIHETGNGTVTKDKDSYSNVDTVTLTVTPESDEYYCSGLSVTKDGKEVVLNEELVFGGTTYTFDVEFANYTVEATFAKKVFKNPSASATNTKWDVLQQNESMKSLVNDAIKVLGKVTATDIKDGTGTDTLNFIGSYTDMEVTFTVKETQETPGSYASGTQVVFDFGGYVLQIRATHSGGVNYLRVVGGLDKNTNVHTFTEAQADKYNSEDGVEVRFVRYGTTLYMYVDGEQCDQSIDLNAYSTTYSKSTKEVTADTEMTVGFKFLSDTNTEVEIPFSITDKISPIAVEVYDDANELVANESTTADVQNIDLTSNEIYSVKLTPQGFDTTAYFKITYVDHVTKETQSVYTPAVAAGESFEFTYQNGVFNAETESNIATILWENRYKATKDVLTVEVIKGAPEGETIEANATIGRAPMKKPSSTYPSTNCNEGAISTTGEIVPMANYVYSDPIVIEKAGTKLTFTDSAKASSWAGSDVLVVSSWKQEANGDYVFDSEGTNIPGQYKPSKTMTFRDMTAAEIAEKGYDTFIERYKSNTIEYMYITSKPNEVIRFCYYAEEGITSFPKIVQTYSGETGTAVEIALASATDTWINAQKTGDTYATYNALFAGKKISVIGDSYMAGSTISTSGDTNDLWISMFANKYGMVLKNHGENGSTISNYAGDKYNPMVDRWATDFENDTPDIIIVEGGRNDYNYNVPMGELGTTDKGTFKGAATYLISSLKEKYPNAIIIGLTCWEVGGNRNAAGYYCSDYGRALIEVCENLEIPYIDAMQSADMNVYMTSSNFMGRFCLKYNDVSHLNEKGMKLVLPVFEEKIYNICK